MLDSIFKRLTGSPKPEVAIADRVRQNLVPEKVRSPLADHLIIWRLQRMMDHTGDLPEIAIMNKARLIIDDKFADLREQLIAYGNSHPVSEPVGPKEAPLINRWYINRDNQIGNCFLHQFQRSDDDRALHDHPWRTLSIILTGMLIEHYPDGIRYFRQPGDIIYRTEEQPHRLEVRKDRDGKVVPTWTLFITGPKTRDWGFHCKNGWKLAQHFETQGGC